MTMIANVEQPAGRWSMLLPTRGLLRVAGPDARAFLQGLISNDIEKITTNRALWAAFLTPQGKFLHDLFLCHEPNTGNADTFLVDCEAARRADLRRRLGLYRLRAQATIEAASEDYAVAVLFGAEALTALGLPAEAGRARTFAGGLVYVDPRLPALGARAVLPRDGASAALAEAGFAPADQTAHDRLRIALGVPDGSRDLEVERSPLLENGFDELGGIDWDKGCFLGQELTARTKYRALIKKRLLPVAIEGPAPPPGTPVMAAGKEVGVMRSSVDGIGLALLRLEETRGLPPGALSSGEARLTVKPPAWFKD